MRQKSHTKDDLCLFWCTAWSMRSEHWWDSQSRTRQQYRWGVVMRQFRVIVTLECEGIKWISDVERQRRGLTWLFSIKVAAIVVGLPPRPPLLQPSIHSSTTMSFHSAWLFYVFNGKLNQSLRLTCLVPQILVRNGRASVILPFWTIRSLSRKMNDHGESLEFLFHISAPSAFVISWTLMLKVRRSAPRLA